MVHLYNTFNLIRNVEMEVRNAYASLMGAEAYAKEVGYRLSSVPEIKDRCMEMIAEVPKRVEMDSITPPMVKVNILLDRAVSLIEGNALSLVKKYKTKQLATNHKNEEEIKHLDLLILLLEGIIEMIKEEQVRVKEYRKANESVVS